VLCCTDGDKVQRGQEFGSIQGSARAILVAERICLNFMQRMSGIATATAAMVAAAAGHKAK
jgi:nicotinate-nucleotide pyrophosphorylase (carboxylating)